MFPTHRVEAAAPSFEYLARIYCPSSLLYLTSKYMHVNAARDLFELTTSFQNIAINLDGIEQELSSAAERDAESVRQDFLQNGIDSSVIENIDGRSTTSRGIISPGMKKLRVKTENRTDHGGCKSREANIKTYRPNRLKRSDKENVHYCVFCYNNGERQERYLSHTCRDAEGYVICAKLSKYICPFCKATGKYAHTKKYCPKKPIITPEDLKNMTIDGKVSLCDTVDCAKTRVSRASRF